MFYSIALAEQKNYSDFYQLGPFVVSTDSGWHQQGSYLYKGYADFFKLSDNLDTVAQEEYPTHTGNYTVLSYKDNQLNIHTDKYRGYPLYIKDNEVTNLVPGGETAWTDSLISVNPDLTVTERKFDVIGTIDTSPLSFDQALAQVDQILNAKTKSFLEFNTAMPIRAYTSGGVDSTLVLSYLRKHTENYTLVQCAHIDYDKFWLLNSYTLKSNYWGYNQIHHWSEPTILSSGTPGDEFMLRSPTTVNWIVRNSNLTIPELLATDKYRDCLHSEYYKQPTHLKIFATEFELTSQEQLIYQICNNLINDWQHWHLGNTLTWTPLRDLEITKLMLRIPVDQLLDQIMDSKFSRSLISPDLNQAISDKKNYENSMSNLVGLYASAAASSGQ